MGTRGFCLKAISYGDIEELEKIFVLCAKPYN